MIAVDVFRNIVAGVSEDIGIEVNYQFGDWQYMAKTLQAMSKSHLTSGKKYPIIGLFSPFTEYRSDATHNLLRLSFLIATATKKEYTNEERLQYSFKDILHPVYDSFMRNIKKDRYLSIDYSGVVKHDYVDNYRYGSSGVYGEGSNKFDDMIDGIDITNLEVKIIKNNCR